MKVNIYLNLDGSASEAIEFYTKALSLKEPEILKFKQLPQSDAYVIPDDMLEKVVHCNLEIENTAIVISDTTPSGDCVVGSNMHIILQFEDFDKLRKVYNKLSKFSDILIPLSWNEYTRGFGMFKDQFGVTWQLNLK